MHTNAGDRKSVRNWVLGGLLLGILIVAFATILVLRSEKFHTYLLDIAQQKASAALGSEVRFSNFSFGWSGTGAVVTLYGIHVGGAPPYSDVPLLRANSLRVQVTISSLVRRSWYVNEFLIERPIVRILADRHGSTNLPQAKSSSSSGNTSVFDLGVRHLAIVGGEVYYNDTKSDLAADVRDLSLSATFDPARTQYAGSISYQNGHVQWRDAAPLPHNLDARFAATPSEFVLENATLATPKSSLTVTASAHNYSQPSILAKYDIVLDTSELRNVLQNPSIPTGTVRLSGNLNYQMTPRRSLWESVNATGELKSPELTVPYQKGTVRFLGVGATIALKDGNATIDRMHANVLGGKLTAAVTMKGLATASRSKLTAQLNGVSTDALQNLVAPDSTSRGTVRGALSMTAEANWGETLSNLVAKAAVTIQAAILPARGSYETPLHGLVRGVYSATNGTLSFDQSYLRTPRTSISISGTVSRQSSLTIRADSSELGELNGLIADLHPAGSPPVDLRGQASLAASVKGSTKAPEVTGRLSASNLQVRGTSWKAIQAGFAANANTFRLQDGQMIPATGGRIDFQLSAALRRWAFTQSSDFQMRLKASAIDAAGIAKVAGLSTPLSGTVSASLEGHGTQLSPFGQGRIELRKARVADEPIRTADLTFQATGDSVVAKLQAGTSAGSATAEVHYQPKQQAYTASLRAIGIKLEQLETIKAQNLQLTGELNVTSDARGTLQNPGGTAIVEIPRLQIRDQVINNIRLDAHVADHLAKLGLTSQMLGVSTSGQGTVQLTGDYPADFSFDTGAIPLQLLMAMYAPAQAPDFTGQTAVHATLHGPLKKKDLLEAHIVVPTLTVNYKNTIQLGAAAPLRADYVNGVLDVRRSVIRGTGTELTLQAHVPAAKEEPVSLLLQGKIDLRIAGALSPDMMSEGELHFDIDSFGPRSDPNVQGRIRIVNASVAQAGVPLGLRDGNGVLTLTRNRLDITQFQGRVGGGNVTASGGVSYRPDLRFDLALRAEGVRLLYQQAIRTTLSSNLALTGHYDSALLQGQLNVEQVSFTSGFDLMDLAGQFGGGATTPPPTGGMSENLRLQIAVQTPGGVDLSSRNLSIAGSANLQVRGTAAQPVLLGRINLSGGDLIFSGNRYLVQGGTIDFRNPSRTEPVIDLAANTTIQQYEIQMHFWGPADHLHTNYSSDPALPPADVINLIAFGKTSEAAAANPTPPGTLGAQSLLASQVSSQVTSRIEKLAGISQLSIDPVFGSSQQSPGARIALQQRVTSKIFVTFATDVTSTQQQAVKMEYKLNRRTSLTFVRNQNGGMSFETSFSKGW